MKTALVLSAGGMYGAYQVGVWKVLSETFQPDLVVGASIGALNGWAIAGGCSGRRLEEIWLHLDALSSFRWRRPPRLRDGFIDCTHVQNLIAQLHEEFQPRIEFGMVATDTLRLRPVLFKGPDLTWQHLAASAAMLGFFSQPRINGRTYSDGGLQCAMPVWAAVEMGAKRVIAVNVLPNMPSKLVRSAVIAIRTVRRFRPRIPKSVEVLEIRAPRGLGSAKDALFWKRANVERWIGLGEADARAALERGRIPSEVM